MTNKTNGLAYRGVVEGFYGARWTHEYRLALLKKMPGWNMNLYIYSARNDPYHRHGWATPYPREELRKFEELAERAAKSKVLFSIGITPGNDYDQSNKQHRRLMMRKLQQFSAMGCRLFPIFYDGVSAPIDFNGASGVAHAEKQAAVINYFLEQLTEKMPQARVLTCPTEFGTSRKSLYLSRLHERLDPRVEVMCTSVDEPDPKTLPRKYCPQTWPTIYSNEGAERYFQNFGRKPFLWDNFNCADFALNQLNWSPYLGRGDRLDTLCAGIVINPQNIGLLNDPFLGTVGEYLANPRTYKPQPALNRSLQASLGKEGALVGQTLAKWYTSEWSGYLSRDANLPDLKKGLSGTQNQRGHFLRQVKQRVAPLLVLKPQFESTLMPIDWACHLDAYVRLLTTWAEALTAVCDGVLAGPITPDQAQNARKGLAELRGASNRLPDSLLDYLEGMLAAWRIFGGAKVRQAARPRRRK